MNKNNFVKCPKCKGAGAHWATLMNHGTHETEQHYVSCEFPGCHAGMVDIQENNRILSGKPEKD